MTKRDTPPCEGKPPTSSRHRWSEWAAKPDCVHSGYPFKQRERRCLNCGQVALEVYSDDPRYLLFAYGAKES